MAVVVSVEIIDEVLVQVAVMVVMVVEVRRVAWLVTRGEAEHEGKVFSEKGSC